MGVPRRQLGQTDLEIPVLGLGTGGPSRFGQTNGVDPESVRELVMSALDHGIDFFDSAPAYGDSELLLGSALAGVDRDRYSVGTKFLPYDTNGELRSTKQLLASVQESLRRLDTDYLDIFSLHAVPPRTFDQVWDTFGEPLQGLVRQGHVRHVGVSEAYVDDHDHDTVRRAIGTPGVDVVMVGYNLLSPSAHATVFPLASREGVGVIVMCASRKVISDPKMLQRVVQKWKHLGLLDDDVPDNGPLDWLLEEAPSITAAAYKFAAQSDHVECVLTGTSSLEHLAENVAAICGSPLSPASISRVLTTYGKVGRNVSPRDAD